MEKETKDKSNKKIQGKNEREKVVGVRFNDDEYEEIQRRADALGLKVAAYMRSVALQDARKN